jgi:hypothetical protein
MKTVAACALAVIWFAAQAAFICFGTLALKFCGVGAIASALVALLIALIGRVQKNKALTDFAVTVAMVGTGTFTTLAAIAVILATLAGDRSFHYNAPSSTWFF